MSRGRVISAILVAIPTIWLLWSCDPEPVQPADETPGVVDLLGGEDEAGFRRARPGERPMLPADHGPHPDFRSEWWYFTGNLETAGGRHFGFQLTFFRFAMAPRPVRRASAWGRVSCGWATWP